MIQRKRTHRYIAGKFPCYIQLDMPSWRASYRKKSILHMSDVTDCLDKTCVSLFNMALSQARMGQKVFLKLDDAIWTIGFREPKHLDNFIDRLPKGSFGTAYTFENTSHQSTLEDYKSRNWIIVDSNTKTSISKFKVWIKKQRTDDERVAKFVQNTQIKHLQTKTFHVLCMDSEDLIARSKLTFPDIDKIEAYLNVDELGES